MFDHQANTNYKLQTNYCNESNDQEKMVDSVDYVLRRLIKSKY